MAGVDEVDNPDEADVLIEAIKSETAQIHTSMPGCITAYDHSTQRASVQPAVRFARQDPDSGDLVYYKPSPITGVPVAFPQGNGGANADTWPLKAGDPVTLVVAERSIDEWLGTGNLDNTPQDPRRHDPTDAIAIPGPSPGALPADAVDAVARVIYAALIKLGSSSAVDPVALSSLVSGNDTSLVAILTPIITAWNLAAVAGGPLIVPMGPAIPFYAPSSVAATKVLAE